MVDHAKLALHASDSGSNYRDLRFSLFQIYRRYHSKVSIREAVILGYVGAGGLGQQIQIAISLFLEHRLLTLILSIYVIVTAVDYLSAYLRNRLV